MPAKGRRQHTERLVVEQAVERVAEDVEVAADDDRLGTRDARVLFDELPDGAELRRLGGALFTVPAELRVRADDVVARAALVDAGVDEALGGAAVALHAIGVNQFLGDTDGMPAGDEHTAVLAEPGIALAAARRVIGEWLLVDNALLAGRGGAAGGAQDAGRVAKALRPEPGEEGRARAVVVGLRQDDHIVRGKEARN